MQLWESIISPLIGHIIAALSLCISWFTLKRTVLISSQTKSISEQMQKVKEETIQKSHFVDQKEALIKKFEGYTAKLEQAGVVTLNDALHYRGTVRIVLSYCPLFSESDALIISNAYEYLESISTSAQTYSEKEYIACKKALDDIRLILKYKGANKIW